ncbi:type II secretion system protein J [Olleya sp. Bg11-27]|uniref:PulJ/GspJ family protein n=1 Tax=Olleya sp. Bg11-27 TaxID=2058135 RepID=UPI001E5624A9|nr:hypothetical protein [Olleya sp. Bg11-27]
MVVLKNRKNFGASSKSIFKSLLTHLNINYRTKGSTLMETLVATVLIVIVFIMASMVLNTMFSSSIKNNTRAIETQLSQLQYLKLSDKLELPYQESLGDWIINVEQYLENNVIVTAFEASNIQTNKIIVIKHNETE